MSWLVDQHGALVERHAAPGSRVAVPSGWRVATSAEVEAERAMRDQRLVHGRGAHLAEHPAAEYRSAGELAQRVPFRLERADLIALNAAATGTDGAIISGHRQPTPFQHVRADRPTVDVEAELGALLDHTNALVRAGQHLEGAAYMAWRLTWLHPHADGNGRSSRALGYAILLAGSESLRQAHQRRTVGRSTLLVPERLERCRSVYLALANAAHAAAVRPDGYDRFVNVDAFAQYLGQLAADQIAGRASREDPTPCACGGRARLLAAVANALTE